MSEKDVVERLDKAIPNLKYMDPIAIALLLAAAQKEIIKLRKIVSVIDYEEHGHSITVKGLKK